MPDSHLPLKIENEYAWTFFGSNAEYYFERWQQWQQGKYVTFNVSAFFAGLCWFAYRRMYFVLFLVFVAVLAEVVAEEALLGPQRSAGATALVTFAFSSLYGIFGNSLYLWDAERKMRRLVRLGLPREDLLPRLRRAGGTSWLFVPVILVVGGLFAGLYWWALQYGQ